MANRPIFVVNTNSKKLFDEISIEFKFFNGFSVSQKGKSIDSLHNSAKKDGYKNILEVSTKSDTELGWKLSAFNLMVDYVDNKKISLECAFQGSKVFEGDIQYNDIYNSESIKAKKDVRLKNSGNIIGFNFLDTFWENEPKTAFYDFLYINTLYKNYPNIIDELMQFDAFTDIEFNPKKSINCQARTCAILVGLKKVNLLDKAMLSKDNFIEIVYPKKYIQKSLFA